MCLSFFWVLLCCHHWPHLTMLQKTCLFLLLLPVSRHFKSGITEPFVLLNNLNSCSDFILFSCILSYLFLVHIFCQHSHSPVYSRTCVSPGFILNYFISIHIFTGTLRDKRYTGLTVEEKV